MTGRKNGWTRRRLLWAWAVLAFAGTARAGEETVVREDWYRVEVAGAPAGWSMNRELVDGERHVTETATHLAFRRGGTAAAVDMESRFVETAGGRPVEAWSRQKLGALPVETTFEFRDGHVAVRSEQNGAARRREVPWPEGPWLPPAALERRIRENLETGTETFAVRTIDPFLGVEPVGTRWQLEERGVEIEAAGRSFLTSRWSTVLDLGPQTVTVSHVDADGRVIRSHMPLLEMTMTLTSREEALGASPGAGRASGATGAGPELLTRSFVPSDRIERPRRVRRAVYEIRARGVELPELPSFAQQRAERDGARVRLVVELGSSPRAADDPEGYLRSSTFISHDAPEVVALLGRALPAGREAAPGERAEALRAFVNGYLVDKDLDTVLGTAVEVAATRSGDCTEHSVLLTALLRAAGIPARVVTGLVYAERFAGAEEIFAYHMWSQALVEERWIDLDATLAGASFDATHIAFGATALDDDQNALLEIARVAGLMGHLEIEVLEVGY